MNRYKFTKASVKKLISYVNKPEGKKPSVLVKFPHEVKKGKLILDGKRVIPKEEVNELLRKKLYDGRTPMTRDAAFYWLAKQFAGISRTHIATFLKSQRVLRESDNQQATSKKAKRKVNTSGQLHVDLVEIIFDKFEKVAGFRPILPKDSRTNKKDIAADEVKRGYFLGVVDSLTSLCKYAWVPFKEQRFVTPVAKKVFEWMSKQLGKPLSKMQVKSDLGSEFDWDTWRTWGIKPFAEKKADPYIEAKNSHFNRVLWRIAKLGKTKKLTELVKLAVIQMNRTQSSVTKTAPFENKKADQRNLAKSYNRKRGKGSGVKIRLRPLVPNTDWVRVQETFPKDKGIGYKAHYGAMWSKKRYKVLKKQGNYYTVQYKHRPRKFHRDQLRLTAEYDKESERLIAYNKRSN